MGRPDERPTAGMRQGRAVRSRPPIGAPAPPIDVPAYPDTPDRMRGVFEYAGRYAPHIRLGSAGTAVQCSSRKCALRRELNSHDAASREQPNAPSNVPDTRRHRAANDTEVRHQFCLQGQARTGQTTAEPNNQDMGARWRIAAAIRSGTAESQSVRRAAAANIGGPTLRSLLRRLEDVACQGCLRGAGGDGCTPREGAGPGQAYCGRRPSGAALPNPSLESRPREAGRLGPAAGSQAHCPLPGQGGLPHGSAQLER